MIFVSILVVLGLVALPSLARADLQVQGFENIKSRNFSKALDCFNAALEEQPNSWEIMQSIANCHMELGRYDRAINFLQKSIESGGLHPTQ
jgi:tetratricopeptide (TPR) repeat protein